MQQDGERDSLLQDLPEHAKGRILPLEAVPERVVAERQKGKTIATLNGSFDLLHAGHLQIIYEASCQADILVVGLNSDYSIQQYKSPDRPIVSLTYRMQMMAALRFVNYVTWFDETTPHRFIEAVHPDVHVNGSDYGKDCIEAELVKSLGAKLHIAKFVPGLSTSSLIEKICALETGTAPLAAQK